MFTVVVDDDGHRGGASRLDNQLLPIKARDEFQFGAIAHSEHLSMSERTYTLLDYGNFNYRDKLWIFAVGEPIVWRVFVLYFFIYLFEECDVCDIADILARFNYLIRYFFKHF